MKNVETLFITEELLKLYGTTSKNVSVDKLLPYAYIAQSYYIEPLLGKRLTEVLKTAIEQEELTDELKALIIKIAPPLASYIEYLSLRSLAYTITEKGITKEKSENSESLNEKELAEFMLDIKNKAEMGIELLQKYLCDCREMYEWNPVYECDCEKFNKTDDGKKNDTAKLIYFPKKKKGCKKCGD